MARRGKKGTNTTQIILIIALLALVAVGGMALFGRAKDPYTGHTSLSVDDYRESANSLRGNVYKITGVIDERLDEWRTSDGRLFSVKVDHLGGTAPVAVHLPAEFNGQNVQRDQEYLFLVEVGDRGLLIAREFQKT